MTEVSDDLARALGKIPSGLFIMTAGEPGSAAGMLASWVMQAGFNPPMVTVCVQEDRPIVKMLVVDSPVVLNSLPAGEKKLLGHFGKGVEPGRDPFEGIELASGSSEVPILADALGYLKGKIRNSMRAGDHLVLAIELTEGKLFRDAEPYIHVRKNGLRY